jgi:small subunit ribosomal protein S2e
LGPPGTNKIKDEVMKVQPVQKQTRAGQRTRFKAFVLVGDFDGHVGLGVKVGKEVANSIRGAILDAKMQVVPVRRGYWGRNIGLPHTVANKIHGKCGSVHIRMVPAPRGTGLVAAPVAKKILQYAGVTDCFTQTRGTTMTLGNFAKATFFALKALYGYLEPTLWKDTKFAKSPFQEFTDDLTDKKVIRSSGAADKYS